MIDADTCHREHTDFSESTDEIAPLTEEEKKARLEELREKLKEKRANQAIVDKEEAKRNEVRWVTVTGHGLARTYSVCSKSA